MPVDTQMPHSVEAEQGVLGSMLVSPRSAIDDAVKVVGPEYFYIPAHQTIFITMVDVWNQGGAVDLITFTQILRDRNLLDNVGGVSAVTSLFTFVPTSSNLGYYLEIMRDKYVLREIITTCAEAARRSYTEQGEVDSLLTEIQNRLLKAGEGRIEEDKTIADFANEAMTELEEVHATRGKIPGLSTGLIDLDRKIGGMRKGQLIVLAGETGQGKTALSLKLAEHNAIHNDIPVGIVSLEMTGSEVSERLIASIGKVDLHGFVTKGGMPDDFPKISDAVIRLAASPLHIQDSPDLTLYKIRGIGREMKRKHGIQLMIVDYIQLISSESKKDENRERDMASASQGLKQMAKELQIVVVALSQLNDQGRLRESRAIGHNADKLIRIERDDDLVANIVTLKVDKNRRGPIGSVEVVFLDRYAQFSDMARGSFDIKSKSAKV